MVLAGVYGSTARGTDTPWSDLELLVIVLSESKLASKTFLYRGTAVSLNVLAEPELEAVLTGPSLTWPFYMGVLSVLKPMYGDKQRVHSWLEEGRAVPEARFRRCLEENLPGLVVESYGRILSCQRRGNTRDIYIAALEVLLEMNTALCLLNRRWVTHDYYRGLEEAFGFSRLPDAYKKLVLRLWDAREIDEIVPLATTLVENYWRLLEGEGVHVPDYHAVDDVPL
jgi:kanamycin nucleotidyltransferase